MAADGDVSDVEAVSRTVRIPTGDRLTDIDVECRTEIVEARSSLTTDRAEIN